MTYLPLRARFLFSLTMTGCTVTEIEPGSTCDQEESSSFSPLALPLCKGSRSPELYSHPPAASHRYEPIALRHRLR